MPEEYSRANKEFRKLENTMELIKGLRSKREVVIWFKIIHAATYCVNRQDS